MPHLRCPSLVGRADEMAMLSAARSMHRARRRGLGVGRSRGRQVSAGVGVLRGGCTARLSGAGWTGGRRRHPGRVPPAVRGVVRVLQAQRRDQGDCGAASCAGTIRSRVAKRRRGAVSGEPDGDRRGVAAVSQLALRRCMCSRARRSPLGGLRNVGGAGVCSRQHRSHAAGVCGDESTARHRRPRSRHAGPTPLRCRDRQLHDSQPLASRTR